MIICIPSKGRPKTKTHELFEASGYTVYHFVEPQDYDSYKVKNKVNIGANDMGTSYVRNFILTWARENSHELICVSDDDITQFGTAKNKKAVKQPNADALNPMFKMFSSGKFALGGCNQRQFAWSESKAYKLNHGKFNGLHLINLKRVSWSFYDGGKEDYDFLMQCFDHRENFIFFPKVFFSCPAIGTNEGGCHEYYQSGRDRLAVNTIAERWPEYTKIVEQYGRIDVKIDFKQKAKDMGLKVV